MADQRAAFKPAAVLVTGLGLTAALLSTGLSGPAAASTSAEARKMVAFEQRLQPSSRSPRVPTPAPVLDLYRVVDQMLDDDPSYWGGAYVDRRRLAVLATEAPVAARQRARQEYGLDSRLLRFQSTKHSLAQLDQATSKTLSEVTAANKTATIGPQFGAESQITVGIKADDPQLRSDLAEVAAETSVPVTVYQTRPAAPKSRLRYNKVAAGAEYIPYNDQGEGGWCSTAAIWRLNGARYAVTAAHCTDQAHRNAAAYDARGFLGPIGTMSYTSATDLGTATTRHGDWALIRLIKKPKPSLWTGGSYGSAESTGSLPVAGRTRFPQGFRGLQTSGRTTGHTEYERVLLVDQTQTYKASDDWWDRWRWWPSKSDVTYTKLTIADRADGDCIRPGDSGGAVYRQVTLNGRAAAEIGGIISGASMDGGRCRLLFTPIKWVKTDVGGKIVKVKR